MKVVHIENTPNPNAVKFNVDGKLIPSGARSYENPETAKGDPLASALFATNKVRSVFFMPHFVTVEKAPDLDWGELHDEIIDIVEKASPAAEAAPAQSAVVGEDARLSQINAIIDERIRPALAMDGGGLEVVGLEGNTLMIRYQGACGSCPSSIAGTLYAIENLLRVDVDPNLQVAAV